MILHKMFMVEFGNKIPAVVYILDNYLMNDILIKSIWNVIR